MDLRQFRHLPLVGGPLRSAHRKVVYTRWLDSLEAAVAGLRRSADSLSARVTSLEAATFPSDDEAALAKALLKLPDRSTPWFPVLLQNPDEAYLQANMDHHQAY